MNRVYAFVTLGVAIAAVALMALGNDLEQHVGWGLWPLLIILPVAAGALRRRELRRR